MGCKVSIVPITSCGLGQDYDFTALEEKVPVEARVHFKFSHLLTGISEADFGKLNDFLPLVVHVNDT